jgi:hypothetical protein
MKPKTSLLLKSLRPTILTQAIQTFDRLTLLIISICWAATLVIMAFALYTVNLSLHVQKDVEAVLATEPTLPRINRSPVVVRDSQVMVERLQRRYPEIVIKWEKDVLSLMGANGGSYRQWLNAIGQVDTLNPQFHWKIQRLCVGSFCGNPNIMNLELTGEKVTLEMPQKDQKK